MKRIVSFLLMTVILLSVFPFTSVVFASDTTPLSLKSFEGNELFDSLALQNGTMTKAELEKATLSDDDIPNFVDRNFLEENGSVKRLKNKEEDFNSLVYQNKDGTLSNVIFSENVKFKDQNGDIKDKTNRLVFDSSISSYINPDNDIKVELPKKIGHGTPVSLSYKEMKISLTPDGASSVAVNSNGAIIYDGVFGNGTKLVYKPLFSGIKEDIILSSLPDSNVFEFTLDVGDLELKCVEGEYLLVDENDELKAYFGELIIYDANGNEGAGFISASQNEIDGTVHYTITVENAFLNSAVYPVTVDPAVLFTTSADIVDTYIDYGSTYTNPSASRIIIGKPTDTAQARRMIIKLPTAANRVINRLENDDVTSVKYYMCVNNNPSTPIPRLLAYRITESWSSTATTVSSTLFSAYDTSLGIGEEIAPANSSSYHAFELLSIFEAWKEGSPNYGIMFKSSNEYSKNLLTVHTMEYSDVEKRPYVVVRYTENFQTEETYGISDKGLYRIATTETTRRYITRTQSSSSQNVSVRTVIDVTGSTKPQSQYVAINYVGGGKYTLSFAITENQNVYLAADENDNIFLDSSIIENGEYSDCGLWRIIFNSITLQYTFVNAEYHTSYLTYNNDNSLSNRPSTISDGDKWYLTKVGMDVPIIKQQDPNWCSAATTLQILTYFGVDEDVQGNSITAKQSYLQNQVDGIVWNMYYTLNTYLNYQIEYDYYSKNTITSLEMMDENIQYSIAQGFPVVLHTWTDVYSYYNGNNYGHYICLVGYDAVTGNYIVRDCNSLEEPDYPYLGEFVVTKAQVYDGTINSKQAHEGIVASDDNKNRYIICKDFD